MKYNEKEEISKAEWVKKAIGLIIVLAGLVAAVIFSIFNYSFANGMSVENKGGSLIGIFFTSPLIIISILICFFGAIFSALGIRNKTKWIKYLYLLLLVLFIAILISTIVMFLMAFNKINS